MCGTHCPILTLVVPAELPECAGYRQFVRDLNPCAREKLLMCGGAVFDPNVRDLVILGFIK